MKRIGVMQITATLNAAGMERVAVNLANLLPSKHHESYLCTTRCDGPLEHDVGESVSRLRLNRKGRFELGALRRLVVFIQANQIDILHAHNDSLFIAVLASLFAPYPSVVWHDHYAEAGVKARPVWLYRWGATRVSTVIAASDLMADWARTRLRVPANRVRYVPNFITTPKKDESESIEIPGVPGARIVCVANLRPQKDHITLIRAMVRVTRQRPTAHLLLVGACRDLVYLEYIRREISENAMEQHVSLLGDRRDVYKILRACSIGVLSSLGEGLPLALLEYGIAGLPTVATRVGQCAEVWMRVA